MEFSILLFETKKIQAETLGEYLKAVRTTFGFSVAAAAQGARINPKWLDALEENKIEQLPADVYVQGSLKQLAGLYGLEENLLIDQYKKEKKILHHIKTKQTSLPADKKTAGNFWRKLVITPKILAIALAGMFVVFTLVYLVWQVLAINRAPVLQITSPNDQDVITSLSVNILGQTDAGMEVAVNGRDVFVDSQGGFKAQVSLTPGPQEINFVAKNRFGKQTQKSVKVFVQPKDTPADTRISLALSFTAPVKLNFSSDGGELKTQEFSLGQTFEIKAKTTILLSASDGGALKGNFNGQDLGILGKSGEALNNVTFSR